MYQSNNIKWRESICLIASRQRGALGYLDKHQTVLKLSADQNVSFNLTWSHVQHNLGQIHTWYHLTGAIHKHSRSHWQMKLCLNPRTTTRQRWIPIFLSWNGSWEQSIETVSKCASALRQACLVQRPLFKLSLQTIKKELAMSKKTLNTLKKKRMSLTFQTGRFHI